MLIEHLKLLEIHVTFLELNALLGIFLHQPLLLAAHFDISKALLFNFSQLLLDALIFLPNGSLDLSDFLLSLLILALQYFFFLIVVFLKPVTGLPLLLLILVEGPPA